MTADRPERSRPQLTPIDFDPFASEREQVVLPLTDPQQEVWTAAQMSREASAAYNVCVPLRLRGRLSIESMRAAVGRLVGRHEALRVTFSPAGNEQAVAREATMPVTESDLRPLAPDARERALAEVLAREIREPFDLSAGPLARMHIVREGDDVHVVVLTAHHLVCDGWSSALVLQDLAALYTADRHGLPPRLPEAMSYGEYVRQSARCTSEETASADYWVHAFSGDVPVLELPTDGSRPPVRLFRGSLERITFDAALYHDIKALGARHGCTLYVTLLAAWQALLMRLSGQHDLVVGIPVSAQSALPNGHLVGHCVHMLPLRLDVGPSTPFARPSGRGAHGARRGSRAPQHHLRPADPAAQPAARRGPRAARRDGLQRRSAQRAADVRGPDPRTPGAAAVRVQLRHRAGHRGYGHRAPYRVQLRRRPVRGRNHPPLARVLPQPDRIGDCRRRRHAGAVADHAGRRAGPAWRGRQGERRVRGALSA